MHDPGQLPPEKIRALKSLISEHLRNEGVYPQIKSLLADYVAEGRGTKEDAVAALKEHGIVERLVQSLATQTVLPVPADRLPQALPDRQYLHVHIARGCAFLDHLHHDCGSDGQSDNFTGTASTLFISARHLRGDAWLLAEAEKLLQQGEPIHIVVVRVSPDGRKSLIGVQKLDWQNVLSRGTCLLPVEICGTGAESGVPAGLLEVRLDLLPKLEKPLAEAAVTGSLQAERARTAEAIARFVSYAKQWWSEYLQIRPGHNRRHIKMLACGEGGEQRPVCTFVRPITAGRLIGSPREAARFVSLLDFREERALGGDRAEWWSHTHTFLARGYGDRYNQQDAHAMQECPYQAVGCVFRHERFYANIQPDDAISATAFDLENQAHWKAMDEGMISLLKKPSTVLFRPNTLNALDEEERLEAGLRRQVTVYRDAELGLSTAWDQNLAHLLLPAVSACEDEARLGIPIPSEFQHAIKRAVPLGHTFKGYPQQFNHTCTARILTQLQSEGVCNDILETRGDQVRFAVRAKIFLYPEDVCAVWVMVAVTYCGVRSA